MSRRITGLFAGAAIALTAASGTIAHAQPAPPAGHAQPMREHHRATPEERAQKLTQVLQLRANQQPAALAFVNAVSPKRDGLRGTHAPKPATTPERLDRMERMMGERQAMMRTRIDATRKFYAQLDPAQQRAFDAMPMMGRGGKHGGKGHGGGWRGHGPGKGGHAPDAG